MSLGEQQLEIQYTQSRAYEPAHWAGPVPEAAAESHEPDVMRRPPHSRCERLLNLPTLRQCLRMPQRPSGELAARFHKQSTAAHRNSSRGGVVAPASLRATTANDARPGVAGDLALVVTCHIRPAAACL
jgi:hypothetical protein